MTGLEKTLSVVALAAAPGAALACSPVLFTPSHTPVAGDDCAIYWELTEIRAVGLSSAQDLSGGLVMQHAFDGNACYWTAQMLVYDCAAGQVLAIGPDNRELMAEPRETGIDRIAARLGDAAAAEPPTTLDAAAELARVEGYDVPATFAAGQSFAMGDWALPTDCACPTFYPETTGGASQ